MLLLPIIFISAFFSPQAHDVSMAMFRLTESENGLSLQINFDREDYMDVNGLEEDLLDIQDFQDYLDRTTSWVMEGKKQIVEVKKLTVINAHIKAECLISLDSKKLEHISIHNEFLLGIEDQSNVIMLELHGQSRGFRMDFNRQQIAVEY